MSLWDHLVLAAALVALGVLLRGHHREGRGYELLVAGIAVAALVSYGRADRFLAVIAVALTVIAVLLPSLFGAAARRAFARGRLQRGVFWSGLRVLLMPGADLARQQQVLAGLGILERDGADAARGYFEGMVRKSDDPAELASLHEQIVETFLHDRRWVEGVSYYEARFHPSHAALRPKLAVGLIRAYGEAGRIDAAAALLRALEDGPVGRDPRGITVVSQARVAFLAYAGDADAVGHALRGDNRRALGFSPALAALYEAIALHRAGRLEAANEACERVRRLAGPGDASSLAASRELVAPRGSERRSEQPPLVQGLENSDGGASGAAAVGLTDELRQYQGAVAARLRRFLELAPALVRRAKARGTMGLLVLFGFGYLGVALWAPVGPFAALRAGAHAPELVASGGFSRFVTALFVQPDPALALFEISCLWIAAPLVEFLRGSWRLGVVAFVAGLGGIWVSLNVGTPPAVVMGGGGVVCGVVGAALLSMTMHERQLAPTGLVRGYALLLVAVLMIHGLVASQAGPVLGTTPLGLVTSTAVGAVLAWPLSWTWGRPSRVLRFAVLAGLLGLGGAAVVEVAGQDPEARVLERLGRRTLERVTFEVPQSFRAIEQSGGRPLGFPLESGLVDERALAMGEVVAVFAGVQPNEGHVLDRLGGSWRSQFDALEEGPWVASLSEPLPSDLVAYGLRRDGVIVATLYERRLREAQGEVAAASAFVLVSPPALADEASRYVRTLVLAASLAPAGEAPLDGVAGAR